MFNHETPVMLWSSGDDNKLIFTLALLADIFPASPTGIANEYTFYAPKLPRTI